MRKCMNHERDRILDYIQKEPEMNLFIYGDIENLGVASENVTIYVEEKENETEWDSLLLRYFDFYILYSPKKDYDTEAIYQVLKEKTVHCLSGKTELISRMASYFPDKTLESTYMCRCNQIRPCSQTLSKAVIRKLTKSDLPQIMELYLLIDEFAATYRDREKQALQEAELKMDHGSLAYGVFENDKLVSIAETSGDNSISAMVVGVATHPNYRQKGYAMAVVSKLCQASFEEGRQFLCLFYDNPTAGKIYHKIGFEPLGEYAMLR